MAVSELLSNGVAKKLVQRPRPPKEWIPHDDVEDRPDSSSFPSGHTAAAVAFTATVLPFWPWAGAACAVPTVLVAVERVHSGAHYPFRRRGRSRDRHRSRRPGTQGAPPPHPLHGTATSRRRVAG
ncbi:phosphatase PAP2 family protein [Streptomyces virginiae]|uniref:phosphatase PAP2 family protein n=1 Tax=Streptomyces virginiae TaxID=1961 RepID=UPI003640EDDF